LDRITTFYRFPDLDARIGLRIVRTRRSSMCYGDRLEVAFLAKGNAYKGTGTARKLYKRNPDRTPAFHRFVDGVEGRVVALTARHGKKDTPRQEVSLNHEADHLRRLYSAGGNYRFDVVLDLTAITPSGRPVELGDVADALGLIPCDNRPVPTAF
jgi:hypothetical protein